MGNDVGFLSESLADKFVCLFEEIYLVSDFLGAMISFIALIFSVINTDI